MLLKNEESRKYGEKLFRRLYFLSLIYFIVFTVLSGSIAVNIGKMSISGINFEADDEASGEGAVD